MPDLPGHGQSSPRPTPYAIQDLAIDLHDLMHPLGLERPFILGYSQGASIALAYALRFPDEVQGLILVSAFSEVSDFYLHGRFYMAQSMASIHGVPLLARSIASSHTDDPALREEWVAHASLTDTATVKHLYAAGHAYRCTDRLPEIQVPALLVYGERDKRMHPYAQQLSHGLTQAELVIIPGVAHQVVTKAADEFNRLCREFSYVKTGG
jgi:pimeloyl-ACP methyl ester carboxylesterase